MASFTLRQLYLLGRSPRLLRVESKMDLIAGMDYVERRKSCPYRE
jgi:hypothetical protein